MAPATDPSCNRATLLQMIFAVFMDRGDSLLLEEYAYPVVTGKLGYSIAVTCNTIADL